MGVDLELPTVANRDVVGVERSQVVVRICEDIAPRMPDACSSDFLAVLDVVSDKLLELRDLLAGRCMDCCSRIINLLVGVLDSLTPILEKSLLLSQSASLCRFLSLLGPLVDLPDIVPVSLGVFDEDLIRDVME